MIQRHICGIQQIFCYRRRKIVNFSPEAVLGYDSEDVFHVPDVESLEIYTKIYGPYFKIGSP